MCRCSLKEYIGLLEEELRLEYGRSMNRIRFDDEVLRHPEEFSHITVPTLEPERVPKKGEMNVTKRNCSFFSSMINIPFLLRAGCVSIPEFPFQENQTAFTLCTLLRQPEVYTVLCEIWVECNKVSDMKLFNVTLLKPMRLEEFKNTQSQMQLQVRPGTAKDKKKPFALTNHLLVSLLPPRQTCTFGRRG